MPGTTATKTDTSTNKQKEQSRRMIGGECDIGKVGDRTPTSHGIKSSYFQEERNKGSVLHS
jgi:hypothetical protein